MNNKNIDSQSESILLKELEHLKLQHTLIINRTFSSVGVDANIFIVIILELLVTF